MKQGVFAVAGGKGGVGKTTTTVNLAATLAERSTEVIVVELDLAMANVVDFLDLETGLDERPTLHDVLADETTAFEAVREAPGGFDVLPSGVELDGFADVDVTRLQWVLTALRSEYDVILLDTGAGISQETVFPIRVADEVILVTTPRAAAVRDTDKTKQLATKSGTDVAGVVFTRSGTGNSPPTEHLADFLDAELLGHVPHDEAVPVAQDAGRPVPRHAPESEAARTYREIASNAFDLPSVDAGDAATTEQTPRSPDHEPGSRPARGASTDGGTPGSTADSATEGATAAPETDGSGATDDGPNAADRVSAERDGASGEAEARGEARRHRDDSLTVRAKRFVTNRLSAGQ